MCFSVMEVDAEFVSSKINLSGVSDLSTEEILSFVCEKCDCVDSTLKIEWIDDNACNVVFPSEEMSEEFLAICSDSSSIQYNESTTLAVRTATAADVKPA